MQALLQPHPALSLLGHEGWFDIDNLQKITKESLRDAVGRSASMIVLFNEETVDSEFCLFEWACAAEAGIPIKVIVDMERCSKKAGETDPRDVCTMTEVAHCLSCGHISRRLRRSRTGPVQQLCSRAI